MEKTLRIPYRSLSDVEYRKGDADIFMTRDANDRFVMTTVDNENDMTMIFCSLKDARRIARAILDVAGEGDSK